MNALLEAPMPDDPKTASPRLKEKILLVDDDPAIRRVLTRLLAEEGYNVLAASTGAEAIHLASRVDFDLVLLDLKMPGMDGWETFEQITSRNPLLPVIVITARPNQNFIALAAGIGALMEKPLDLEKLLPTIRKLLDEPEDVRLARMAGRLSKFYYISSAARGSNDNKME